MFTGSLGFGLTIFFDMKSLDLVNICTRDHECNITFIRSFSNIFLYTLDMVLNIYISQLYSGSNILVRDIRNFRYLFVF